MTHDEAVKRAGEIYYRLNQRAIGNLIKVVERNEESESIIASELQKAYLDGYEDGIEDAR